MLTASEEVATVALDAAAVLIEKQRDRIAALEAALQASRFPVPDPTTVEREQEVLMLFTVEQARLWNARIDAALAQPVGGQS